MRIALMLLMLVAILPFCIAEIHLNAGSDQELPHDKYVRRVSETESPVERLYLKTKDGLYVAAALRKPRGTGPFPALIHFHGAPGGRGMDQLVGWARGATGSPVWERFLMEGFVVVVADYRGGPFPKGDGLPAGETTYADDGISVLEFVRTLPFVDKSRITLYGVSLGGDVVLHMLSRTTVHAAILGAPAPINFLGATSPSAKPEDRWKLAQLNQELAAKNIGPVNTPLLILAGTADPLVDLDRKLHDELTRAGKPVRMEVYEKGYHDFCMGPQGQNRKEPLLDSTLAALEVSLDFARGGAH